MTNITEKFDHLYKVISSSNFLKKQSLGGEIPFFISTYEAEDENEVKIAIRLLQNKLNSQGIKVLELNLYNISCEILEAKGGIERMFRVEQRKSKDKFLRALQSSLNIHQVLMPKIKEMIDESEAKVYFLTGIGACYPFIRSHNVLNNLQNVARDCPTVAFFPGEYNGHSLNLFGLLKDDNYYRAFNINTIKA
ncbi:DUF1788 domain-containing protein [Christiangramia fulva]|uniref:DUF1788 domain-containing protein n=1 Tax=Christiangramia fulva TaxID=2126553 RepID=A0A2R3Z3D1_9FLAO|nr:DUF1788 domain-containing protein [Christiangramia fulva]AVR44780.1 DUF1788 domain-containing protein [Christiangramia fulva]